MVVVVVVGWLVGWKAIWELSRSCLPSVAGGHRPEAREVPGFGFGGKERKERKGERDDRSRIGCTYTRVVGVSVAPVQHNGQRGQ